MDTAKVFQDRNVISICDYVSKYCELYVINSTTISGLYVRAFHSFFPTLLVYIFGSPTARGWIQTETQAAQDSAIKNLLSVNGHFFQALLKLSHHPEYSYDLVTDSLPADVRKVLSSGAIHLLPRVYSNSTYLVTSSTTGSVDIRAAATRQSTLLPPTVGGDRRIKFNMLQFYLYYFTSVPTWPPLTPPPQQTLSHTYSGARPTTTTTISPSNHHQTLPKTYQYGTVKQASPTPTYNTNSNNTNTTPPYQLPGTLRPITHSVYDAVVEEYLSRLVPITPNSNAFLPIVDSFLLDACVELWIRTPWIATHQKLSSEYMHYITTFIKYIVRHDLKQCAINGKSLLYKVYSSVKDELYMLISRLALNWSKHDDYLQVVELWCIWAAPWKLGVAPRSSEKQEFSPIQTGWSIFVLDNLPYYISLVDIFLQRTSTFLYKDSIQSIANVPLSSYTDGGTIGGQLRIVYRLINVLKANGLVKFLGYVERGFKKLQSGAMTSTDPFKKLSMLTYASEKMDHTVHDKLKLVYDMLVVLEGGSEWKPKGLYDKDMKPRSDALLKTLNAINNAAWMREGKGVVTANVAKSVKYAEELKGAYQHLYNTLKVVGDEHLMTMDPKTSTTTRQIGGPNMNNVQKTQWVTPTYVGLKNGGFLTEEEKLQIRQGKAFCSHDNIPAVGERAINYVRSYEIPLLVRWTVRMDVKINDKYNQWIPESKRPDFLPKKLTLRHFARRINLLYTAATVLLLFYLFIKMIF